MYIIGTKDEALAFQDTLLEIEEQPLGTKEEALAFQDTSSEKEKQPLDTKEPLAFQNEKYTKGKI